MRTKKYPVRLGEIETQKLKAIINAGEHPATIVKRANILLQLDESNGKSRTQKEIAEICHCCIVILTISNFSILEKMSGDENVSNFKLETFYNGYQAEYNEKDSVKGG